MVGVILLVMGLSLDKRIAVQGRVGHLDDLSAASDVVGDRFPEACLQFVRALNAISLTKLGGKTEDNIAPSSQRGKEDWRLKFKCADVVAIAAGPDWSFRSH